tara:strand:- start:667 stop:1653 length:987 start_codon:yes stop_codon:yes gene_type:complete
MKICFLDSTKFEYSYLDKHSPILRGAETILINLSENLKKLGHNVTVFNNCPNDINENSLNWYNINKINNNNNLDFDVAIANADMRLLNKVNAKKKVIISYSLQSIEKFIRKGQLLSYFKERPLVYVIGDYHMKKRSNLISLFGKKILDISIDDLFIETKLLNNIDKNLAIFSSRPDRNLSILIDIWNNKIFPNYNLGKLLVTPSDKFKEINNVKFRKMGTHNELIKDLLKSRIFLVPGHKAELFCLAAEEARELCIPIVTLGIGSLSERVEHEKTGFVAKNDNEFANYTIELFKNDTVWNNIRSNLINLRSSRTWKISTKKFIESLND